MHLPPALMNHQHTHSNKQKTELNTFHLNSGCLKVPFSRHLSHFINLQRTVKVGDEAIYRKKMNHGLTNYKESYPKLEMSSYITDLHNGSFFWVIYILGKCQTLAPKTS